MAARNASTDRTRPAPAAPSRLRKTMPMISSKRTGSVTAAATRSANANGGNSPISRMHTSPSRDDSV
ncbi:hypothetical protein DIPPA_18509 [Diplonema papillatum]|nr:hypothetical protein DIPPA_18509 [Diplonema papillatum]